MSSFVGFVFNRFTILLLLTSNFSLLIPLWAHHNAMYMMAFMPLIMRPPGAELEVKQGFNFSKTLLDEKSYFFSKSDLRLRWDRSLGGDFKFHVEGDALFYGGPYLRESEWRDFVSALLEGRSALDWEKRLELDSANEARLRFYRIYFGRDFDFGQIQAGRLRHGLGNTRIFLSPLDRLDDLATFVSDDLERPGADSIQIKFSPNEISNFKSGYLWAKSRADWRAYAAGEVLIKEGLQATALLGRLEPKTNGLGLAAQYSIFESEIKTELSLNRREFEKQTLEIVGLVPTIKTSTQKENFSRFNVGWERSLTGDLNLAAEYFHNGRGANAAQNYDFLSLLRGEDYYLARDYLGVSASKTISPLWSASGQVLFNHTDGSLSFQPKLEFLSASSKFELTLKPSFYFGGEASEFGRLPDRFLLSLTVYL